jgi:hypothetical protein
MAWSLPVCINARQIFNYLAKVCYAMRMLAWPVLLQQKYRKLPPPPQKKSILVALLRSLCTTPFLSHHSYFGLLNLMSFDLPYPGCQ